MENEAKQPPTKRKGVLDIEARKRLTTISLLETTFEQLESVFNSAHYIEEVVILLGSTSVTPKETYSIKFPTAMYEGKLLSLQQAKTCLFRQLVTNPCWVDVPEMRPTKLHVFILAARDDRLASLGLKPRLTFKKPNKGRTFSITFDCKCTVVSAELSRLGDADFEISGVEPLDTSDFLENDTSVNVPTGAHNGDLHNHTQIHAQGEEDFIWYQLPIVVQGLKTKSK